MKANPKVKARTKETQSEERSEAEALRELMEETRAVLESEAGEAFGRKVRALSHANARVRLEPIPFRYWIPLRKGEPKAGTLDALTSGLRGYGYAFSVAHALGVLPGQLQMLTKAWGLSEEEAGPGLVLICDCFPVSGVSVDECFSDGFRLSSF